MSRKITTSNVYNYLDGNGKFIIDKLGLSQPHIKEQVARRLLTCKDTCVPEGKCRVCTCPLPNRAFSTQSCNKELFPDLMNEQDWITYKQANGIE